MTYNAGRTGVDSFVRRWAWIPCPFDPQWMSGVREATLKSQWWGPLSAECRYRRGQYR